LKVVASPASYGGPLEINEIFLETHMKMITPLLALSLAAGAVSGTVYAQDGSSKTSDAKTIYEGVDARGQIVRVTVSSPAAGQPISVSSRAPQYPELHWTARIGSGTAAVIAH
jgi:hypothetical protein